MSWLNDYYGPKFEELNPSIIMEGQRYAVVRLVPKKPVSGFSASSYVLIRKTGRYGSTKHQSLFEGVPDTFDNNKMKAALDKAETGK